MDPESEDVSIRLDFKHIITLVFLITIIGYSLVFYVNAMANYRPTIVSQYVPYRPPNSFPIADAGPDQEVFVNQTVYFDGSGSEDSDGTIMEYSWSFGDDESAMGVAVSHRYVAEGVYEVTLTVTDDDAASDIDVLTVTVNEPSPELLGLLSPEDAAAYLEDIEVESALDLLLGFNLSRAAEIAQALNKTTLVEIVETAANINKTSEISEILLELGLGDVTDLLLGLDPEVSARVLESMSELNSTRRDEFIEMLVSLDEKITASILGLMEPQLLPEILIELEDEIVAKVLFGLDASSSAQILESMVAINVDKCTLVVEYMILIDQNELVNILEQMVTQALFEILVDMEGEFLTKVIFSLDDSSGAQVLESMADYNVTECALIIETLVNSDINITADILEVMETQALLEILVEITQLSSSPSTVAAIIESLSIEKSVELSKAWISTAHIQKVGIVWRFLSSDTVNSIFGDLGIDERQSIYSYLSSETVSVIQIGLLPLPDITVKSFTISRVDSRAYQLNGTVENLGNVESGTFVADLLIDDEFSEQYQFSNLLPGESTVFTFEWKPMFRGSYAFEAIVDNANMIEEIDETNNVITWTYGVELPDITVGLSSPNTEFFEGNSYVLTVEVSNIGEEEAALFELKVEGSGILIENGDVRWVPIDVGSSIIEDLSPNTMKTLEFSWTPETSGAYTLEAKADPLGVMLEAVRENNIAEIRIEVKEKPSNLTSILTLTGIAVVIAAGAIYFYRSKIQAFLSKYRVTISRVRE